MTAIKVELELVDGSFTTRMLHAGETIEQFNRNVARSSPALRQLAADNQLVIRSMEKSDEAGRGFLATLRDVSIVATALSAGVNKLVNVQDTWVGAVIKTNAQFQKLNIMLRGMSDAADPVKDAANQLNTLVDMAAKAPFSLDKITDSFTKLKATGTDPMNGSLKAIMDGVAHFGKGGEELERTVLGISQASGKGVIQMEELRQQIGETMPQAMQLMAASMGVSMSKLVADISKGRMAAGPALEALYAELDRSFGGSAERMMQTFSGQLGRTSTELQKFAQIIGGISKETGDATEGGFFDIVTQQVKALNEALASQGGQVFAAQVGQSLSTVAQWLQVIVEKAVQFRSSLENAFQFAAIAAGFKLVGAAWNSLSAGYSNIMRSIDMLKIKFADANTMLAAHANALRNTAVGYESVDRIARMQAAVSMKAVGAAAISFIPQAALLGLAIYEIADAFDVFGNRGKEAVETLREFGKIAKDQLPKAEKNINDRQSDLNKQKQQIVDDNNGSFYFGTQKAKKAAAQQGITSDFEKYDIAGKQAQIDADRRKLDEAKVAQAEEDAKKTADFQLAQLGRIDAAEERSYGQRKEAIQKAFDAQLIEEKKNNGDLDKVEKARAKALFDNAAEYYQTQMTEASDAVKKLWANNGIGPMPLSSQLQLDELNKRLDSTRTKMSSLSTISGTTPDLGPKNNSAQELSNLQKTVARTQDDVAGLEDKLHGGNSELGAFLSKLERGAYGNKSAEDVKQLSAEMVTLLQRKKALEDMNKGVEDITSDIENARLKLVERRVALEEKQRGRPLSDAEKITLKLDSGGYKGLGPDALTTVNAAVKSLTMGGRVTDALGKSFDQTFGKVAETKIVTLNDVLSKTLGIITGIGNGVNGIDFSGMSKGLAGSPMMGSNGFKLTGTSGTLLDLIAGGESGGDYNATLDNGKWTNGSQNLTGMSLNQVRELQRQMLMNPGNRAQYGDGKGSSALGKYQIVGTTLDSLMKEMNLSGNEMYDPAMQDRMAMQLVNRRLGSGQGLTGMRNEWTSLKNVPDSVLTNAIRTGANGPTREKAAGLALPAYNPNIKTDLDNPFGGSADAAKDTNATYAETNAYLEKMAAVSAEAKVSLDGLAKSDADLTAEEKKQKGDDAKIELKRKIDEAKESLDGFDKNYRAVSKLIAKGEFGDKDMNSDANKERLQLAKDLDKAEKDRGDRQTASNNITSQDVKLSEQRVNLEKQINDLKAKAKNPNVKLDSSGLVSLRTELDKYVADTATVYGKDSDEYAKALDKKKQSLAMFGQSELLADVAASNDKTRTLNQGLQTEAQARKSAMQQELDEVDQKMAYYRQQGTLDVDATNQFEAEKAAIRQKYAAQDPMSNLMKQWGDLQGNLTRASAQWMDSLADGLTGLIMGTGDLKQALQGIARDIINMSLKKVMSGFMGNKGGAGTSGAGGGILSKASKGGGQAAAAASGSIVGLFHSGGLAGAAAPMTRMVDPAMFRTAPKYHSGANAIGGRRLMPGEIPIIAKDDEGIFTKEQMAAMGTKMASSNTSNAVTINAPVTVNASGGSKDQNADLAKQVSAQMESTMRATVVSELQRQMKPGNILSGAGRR
jgi:tape measure domain-containing protein